MKTGCVAFFFACCCVGAVQAGALALTSVKPYDFNSIVVKGTGVGDATMTVNGAPATTTKVSADELVATGLSAQCTDKRVNMVTPALLYDYPTAEAMALATPEVIYEYIKSISYPNNKAKHLIGMAQMLVNDFGSEVPSDVDELVKLPGVGRKTANVIASVIYDKPVIAVDTHVFRVSHRMGLSDGKTVEAVEKELTAGIAPEERPIAHHWLILHGRYICTARKPKCESCGIAPFCRMHEKEEIR